MQHGIRFYLGHGFDRYVAICDPLRHSTILTHRVIKNLGLAIVFCGVLLFSPQSFMLRWLPYCRTNIIPHTYCEFMALIKLACVETRICRIYSLTAAFLTGGLDFLLILCSNVIILYTVFHFPSKAARLKTLGTCGSHVCVILMAYTPVFFTFLTHRFGQHVAPHIHIFVANIYLLVPPMVNPMIYGIRTKRIRDRFKLLHFTNSETRTSSTILSLSCRLIEEKNKKTLTLLLKAQSLYLLFLIFKLLIIIDWILFFREFLGKWQI